MTTQQASGSNLIKKTSAKQKNLFLDSFVTTLLLLKDWPFTVDEKQHSILDKNGNPIHYASTAKEAADLLTLITKYREVTSDPAIIEDVEEKEFVEEVA